MKVLRKIIAEKTHPYIYIRSLDTIMLTSWAPHSLLFPCKEGAGRSTYLCPCPLWYMAPKYWTRCFQKRSTATLLNSVIYYHIWFESYWLYCWIFIVWCNRQGFIFPLKIGIISLESINWFELTCAVLMEFKESFNDWIFTMAASFLNGSYGATRKTAAKLNTKGKYWKYRYTEFFFRISLFIISSVRYS